MTVLKKPFYANKVKFSSIGKNAKVIKNVKRTESHANIYNTRNFFCLAVKGQNVDF
jgi:hypothetical protein